jgi:hypothetical protein
MSSEPIVFWGPGSEWFWSMAQFVVVAVTLLGIYYQFRLQRAANAFDQINRIADQWESEEMLRARLAICRAFVAGTEMPEAAMVSIGNYWEYIASLVRAGHVNERLVSQTIGGGAPITWGVIAEQTARLRVERMDPTIFVNFEWLTKRMSNDGAKVGAPREYDIETLRRIYVAAMPGLEDRLRTAEESRMTPERRAPRARRSTGPK